MDDITKTFVIHPITEVKCKNIKNFDIKEFSKLKDELIGAKNKMGLPYSINPRGFYFITRKFEHASSFRKFIQKKYNAHGVTNAWLKAYEIFTHYNLIGEELKTLNYFDNAAFPGTFIFATHHIVKTKTKITNFNWYGSSLFDPTGENKTPLGDTYNLYKKFPEHWLMSGDNNGDVTDINNQLNFAKRLDGKIDLYTSDLGFDVSQDYANQELLQARANMGQIITGLMVLREGGSMFTKQYTYMEPFTISLMGAMTILFDRVEICKPLFSKSGNSETYLVCLGYKKPGLDHPVIASMLNRLRNWNTKPLLTKTCLGKRFLSSIIKSQTYFAEKQINKLNLMMKEYYRFRKMKRPSADYIEKNNIFYKKNQEELANWLRKNKLIKLKTNLIKT